jgi:hypothetical protein
LEDETDFAIANARALREGKIRDLVTFQRVTAIGRSIQQTEYRKQRCLAATGRSRNGNIFALTNIEMNSGKRVRFYFVSEKHLGDATEPD